MDLAVLFVVVLCCSAVGAFLDGFRGALLGAFMGPFGVVAAAIVSVRK